MSIPRRSFVATLASAALAGAAEFASHFPADAEQTWLGPEYWANPLQDWRLHNGRMENVVAGGDRNIFLLTRELSAEPAAFTTSVTLGRLESDSTPLEDGYAGFRIGIRGHFKDYRDSAVRGVGLDAGITSDGRLFINKPNPNSPKLPSAWTASTQLTLRATPAGDGYSVTLEAGDQRIQVEHIPADKLTGGLALVCSSSPSSEASAPLYPLQPSGTNKINTQRGGTLRFWFRDWKVSGPKVTAHEDRAFGPILFAMHTLSRGTLKLTAQMAPAATTAPVKLEIFDGATRRAEATSVIDPLARTATFRLPNFDSTKDHRYRLTFGTQTYEGTIRREPKDAAKLTIGALTCNNDLGFPHNDIAASLRHFRPDILFFTGDQIYERVGEYGIQREPLGPAALDYLRKWYLFGWAYRDLLRDTPTVAMPDDHDVFHGNVWGAGGKRATLNSNAQVFGKDANGDPYPRQKALQDAGGYIEPADWVNAVQRTQTSHLPDPVDPEPVNQGINVYFTHLVYGGVSFAILEDRKWKSAPRPTIPWADLQNGWAQNPKYDAPRDGDVKGAELLGPRQIKFLEQWAQDWKDSYLKIVVSQTIFADIGTLPKPANNDNVTPRLPLLKPDEYPTDEVCVADHDSNGWPQTPRNHALRAMRKAVAFHIGGDQHLGSTSQYGIDDFNDGPYAICSPAIANLFPRRWYPPVDGKNRRPGAPRNTGEFIEGFGNKITVHAVANPVKFGVNPGVLYDRATGYSIIEVDRATRRLTLTNWPRWVDHAKPGAKPYDGWPITIHQYDNGLTMAKFQLPTVDLKSTPDAIVQVVNQGTGETVYTVRAHGTSFTPKVWAAGTYTVKVLEPKPRTIANQRAKPV